MQTSRPHNLAKPLFIEGITRTGKFLLGKVLAGFERIEYFQYVSMLEHIGYLHYLQKIPEDVAVALLKAQVDEHSYNYAIGRNLNTRKEDASCIDNHPYSIEYLSAAMTPISAFAWNVSKSFYQFESSYFPFVLHESFVNAPLLLKAFPDCKIINLIRHPIDLVYSWYEKGLGKRWTDDPLVFQPLFQIGEYTVPWYAVDWAEEYRKSAEVERVIKSVSKLRQLEHSAYETLSDEQKKQVLRVSYEELVGKPYGTAKGLREFLGQGSTKAIDTIFARERLPNHIIKERRKRRYKEIEQKRGIDTLNRLYSFAIRYEEAEPEYVISS